jgi:predicted nucleotidyltransferase
VLDTRALASQCEAVLAAEPRLRAAIVFGSVARGKASAASDVDIAVVGSDIDTLALGAALSQLVGRDVDVVEVSFESPIPLLRALLRDGRILYERNPGQAAEFLSRVRTVLDLDGPGYDFMLGAFMERVARRGVGS